MRLRKLHLPVSADYPFGAKQHLRVVVSILLLFGHPHHQIDPQSHGEASQRLHGGAVECLSLSRAREITR
ncbi:Uncharacterised protein [Yersinia enterocolitica]|nr:Uncharacterised protein [Yersinia enterocolitica]